MISVVVRGQNCQSHQVFVMNATVAQRRLSWWRLDKHHHFSATASIPLVGHALPATRAALLSRQTSSSLGEGGFHFASLSYHSIGSGAVTPTTATAVAGPTDTFSAMLVPTSHRRSCNPFFQMPWTQLNPLFLQLSHKRLKSLELRCQIWWRHWRRRVCFLGLLNSFDATAADVPDLLPTRTPI